MAGAYRRPDWPADKILISVVIPTKDSERTLGQCIDSIRHQNRTDVEIIVVDSDSSDRTEAIASSCRFISKSASTAAARNIGFKEARGDIFISVDSDMVLESGLFSEIVGLMESKDALFIPETGKGVSLLSRLKALEKRFYMNNAGIECVRVFSRAAFFRNHGYDESLRLAEDRDLHSRVCTGSKVGRTKRRVFHDTDGLTLYSDMRKSYVYGRS